MYENKVLIRDVFGQNYIIIAYFPPGIKAKLKPEFFWDPCLTHQFVWDLRVPSGYWHWLLHDICHFDIHMMSKADAIGIACECLVSGQLMMIAVNPASCASDSVKKRTIQTKDKVVHFIPAAEQLLHDI